MKIFALHAVHPTIPGDILRLFATEAEAERAAKALVISIGDDLHSNEAEGPMALEGWALAKMNDFEAVRDWLKDATAELDLDSKWDVYIDPMPVEQTPEARLRSIELDQLARNAMLSVAIKQPGEDDGLPLALAMVDQLIDMGGEVATVARFARRAMLNIVRAAVELHAAMGEAMETHIYDLDNGDTIPGDCQFQTAMDALNAALMGRPETYAKTGSPLPWTLAVNDQLAAIIAADGTRTGIPDRQLPTLRDIADLTAVVESVNGRDAARMTPELCICVSGGVVQDVLARNDAPVTVYLVDFDTDGSTADLTGIPQFTMAGERSDDAMAHAARFTVERSTTSELWAVLDGLQ